VKRNVEFKAELRDPNLAISIALALGARHVGTLDQTDTYYRVPSGRLKKRETVGEPTEWILYHRPDTTSAKLSEFTVYGEEEAAERFGTAPMPVWVVVKKMRELFLLDNVRIHLDAVEKLGNFLEFEALVRPGRSRPTCESAVAKLRADFSPAIGGAIATSYSDMIAEEGTGR
jgi:adenylate cyclase class IV